MPEILLIGASGLAREVLSLLRAQADPRQVVFIDDQPDLWGTSIDGVLIAGGLPEVAKHPTAQIVLCVGRGAGRAALVDRLTGLGVAKERYARVIHRSVEIPDSCRIGTGSIVLAGVVLTADVQIGDHVVVMPHVTLTHGNRIDSFATLCAGVTLGGDVHIGSGAYLGMQAGVRERVTVGVGATIGMAAAVLGDVPPHDTWIGVPARSHLIGSRI
ncbi:hypothetical protein GY21_05485 [Cryobacterium roopkundense]|uniref:Sugar O-acyltransferase (Sialic acid O-acetyltransferase NeuD family) n=1 Tax=Cryobacterium roopkundense TaxID=1001240 RepID=A0A099JMH9_9MICO|nr:NeuD/PglB/VioB family sugar acetyltransferase [Cryobacterium roopkundense]KGJ79345.1 hypothetical protein GY21_05485 [Cryobacterium roopkundense]MBB5642786.1 sugar O-acyltransferase (sialic acid O-acetyltransferase NeuD family) [Cryobacterium roopkundense]